MQGLVDLVYIQPQGTETPLSQFVLLNTARIPSHPRIKPKIASRKPQAASRGSHSPPFENPRPLFPLFIRRLHRKIYCSFWSVYWAAMFGDCVLCLPCFGRHCRPRNGSNDTDREPVLLVSGIGGSIFNSKQKKNDSLLRVWVQILFSNYEFKKCLWSMYNSETRYTETLNPDIDIVVPEDDYGLYVIDILDPTWWVKCMHVTDVYHFHDMIEMLIDCGYKKRTTLFGYGYDFHQSNRIDKAMDGLKVKLQTAYKASGG